VKELENVLPRLLDIMAKVSAEKHIHFSKLDLTDKYSLMSVKRREQRWNFASIMPAKPDKELMVVVPSAIPVFGICPSSLLRSDPS
jgi:hypothetical protein